MHRRLFLQALGLSPAVLLGCTKSPEQLYTPAADFGHVTLLHITDCHAQLLPIYYREPSVNLGLGSNKGLPPHQVGQQFLDYFGIREKSAKAHAYTYLNFSEAAAEYGSMGGYAHLATLIKQLRAQRGEENTVLLDGGDSWQGSATALWTQAKDMLDANNLLGVDVMTGHWEFTYGSRRVMENIAAFNGHFVAQNIVLSEEAQFANESDSDTVFKPYVIKRTKNARIAIIGQSFPYTPIANPRRFIPDWQFGIREQRLQNLIDVLHKENKADVIVLLSHNGADVDLKLASRVSGIDFIMGGHTHDAIPSALMVANPGGKTWVTNAGSHGKFVAALDLQMSDGRMSDFRYRLIPVFSNLLEPDPEMQELIANVRNPYLSRLQNPLAITEKLLYRRDNFYGTFDQVILDAQRQINAAEISLSPGFRWGTSLLPGMMITFEDVMNQTAITYPETYVRLISGRELKDILEDVCDNLFNKDPYYRQGGDMVRVGGLSYKCNPNAAIGARISELRRDNGELIVAAKRYKVSGWASVGQASDGKPIWDVVTEYLRDKQEIVPGNSTPPEIICT